jgi:predicted ribosomally synthesized peptide with nif11-like leader
MDRKNTGHNETAWEDNVKLKCYNGVVNDIGHHKNDVQNNTMIGRTLNMAGLKEFLEKLEGDTGLQEKVKAAVDENALLKVVTDAGYDVKLEELKAFLDDTAKEGALSDDDLDNVAGGKATTIDNPEEIKSWEDVCRCLK